MYEGETYIMGGGTTRKSSRRQFNGIHEELSKIENYNSAGGTVQSYLASNRVRGDPPKSSNKPCCFISQSWLLKLKLLLVKIIMSSIAQAQKKSGRDSKSGQKLDHYLAGEYIAKGMNGPSNPPGRSSSFAHNKSNSGVSKDHKYVCNSTNYQIGPHSDISILDYKYTDEVKDDNIKRQHSTNDFVNYESVLQHEKEDDKEALDGSALFNDKYLDNTKL